MNMPALDGRGSRRTSGRRWRGPLVVRTLAAAVGASTLLVVAGCTSTGTEVPRTTAESAAGVTTASVPYAGVDPSAAGQTDQPANATESGADVPVAAPATTVVPAPGGDGNIQETVPTSAVTSNAPVGLAATGDYGTGVTITLGSIESVTTDALQAGEVAGPGVRFEVTIANGSADPIDLTNVIVNLADANGTPAIQMSSGSTPFAGSIDAGASATATYVFSTPAGYTDPATISVSYAASAPVVVFSGDAK